MIKSNIFLLFELRNKFAVGAKQFGRDVIAVVTSPGEEKKKKKRQKRKPHHVFVSQQALPDPTWNPMPNQTTCTQAQTIIIIQQQQPNNSPTTINNNHQQLQLSFT